jgi:hypothetical protein
MTGERFADQRRYAIIHTPMQEEGLFQGKLGSSRQNHTLPPINSL